MFTPMGENSLMFLYTEGLYPSRIEYKVHPKGTKFRYDWKYELESAVSFSASEGSLL
jgi:hypothetical protein